MEKTLLIVEDDLDIQHYYEIVLSDYPLRILKAENGKEALAIIDKEEQIDLIILDVVMPIMDGEEFIKVLQNERGLDIPVIVSSVDEVFSSRIEKLAVVKGTFFKLATVDELRALVLGILEM